MTVFLFHPIDLKLYVFCLFLGSRFFPEELFEEDSAFWKEFSEDVRG